MIRIYPYGQVPDEEIFARVQDDRDVSGIVADIIARVRAQGDKALAAYAEQFDGAAPERLEVTGAELDAAVAALDPEFVEILRQAAANIEAFHKHQVRSSFVVTDQPGVVMGQKVLPIEKVGLYVPGGTAAYPSSVLMNCIPAFTVESRGEWNILPLRSGIIRRLWQV